MTYSTDDIEQMAQDLSSTLGNMVEAIRVRNYDWQESYDLVKSLKEEVVKLQDHISILTNKNHMLEKHNDFLEGLVSTTVDA